MDGGNHQRDGCQWVERCGLHVLPSSWTKQHLQCAWVTDTDRTDQIDCGWQAYDRLPNGSITYDTSRFPDGILPVSDLAKSKGFIFSMYTDQGRYSCDTGTPGRAGSLGYESEDAERFAYWGAEYMKVDNCYITGLDANAPKAPRTDFPPRFGAMWEALSEVGIAEMLVCQWGVPWINNTGEYSILEGPAEWAPPISTSFRVSDDIADGWPNVERIANENIHVVLRGLSGPGSWSGKYGRNVEVWCET